jgi:aquaglyceroporin related protein, other eukaryote
MTPTKPLSPTKDDEQMERFPTVGQDIGAGDDGADLDTLHPEDEPEYYADMAPLMENFDLEDEVHNNHNAWSVVRTHHREFLAELLSVFVQLTFGFCADLQSTLGASGSPNSTPWAWGLATMAAIYVSGGISGAHLNPVITMVLWFYRGFPKRKMPEYFLAQFIGALIAAFTAYGLYYASIHDFENAHDTGVNSIVTSFVTSQRQTFIDAATAFFNEFMGTAMLVIVILALGDDSNAPPGAGMNAFVIGLVVTLLNYTFTYQTGFAGNPSRDFGPRLALLALGYGSELFTNPYWFYGPWAGALCGASIGGLLYDAAIFTGGESPVNYPWTRTKRAMRKSKKKWRRRLRLQGKEEKEEDLIQ